jgi:hypothetical protein
MLPKSRKTFDSNAGSGQIVVKLATHMPPRGGTAPFSRAPLGVHPVTKPAEFQAGASFAGAWHSQLLQRIWTQSGFQRLFAGFGLNLGNYPVRAM